jgi:uncharacterized membrane protein YdbT with pleckstrin-like domain
MWYIEKTLGKNEKLLYRAGFHWFKRITGYAGIAIAILAVTLAFYFFLDKFIVRYLMIALALAVSYLALRRLFPIWTTEIGVTDRRLVLKTGWLSRSTKELQLKFIEKVTLEQSLMGRLFDYGTVKVVGPGDDDVDLPEIAQPLQLLQAIEEAASAYKIVQPHKTATNGGA